MFIIERVRAEAEIREQQEINNIVAALARAGYKPALRSMVEAAAQSATLKGRRLGVEILVNREARYRALGHDADGPIGDLLFGILSFFSILNADEVGRF
jgi:hypothetical protein